MSKSDITDGDGSGNSAGDQFSEGDRDSRSPQEKRDSAQEHYSRGEVENNMFERPINPVAEEIWNENERSPKPDGWMGR